MISRAPSRPWTTVRPLANRLILDLGAGWASVLRRVHLQIAAPALIVALVTAFQVSFDELYLAYFLTGFEPNAASFFFSSLRRPHLLLPAVALTSIVTIASVIVIGLSWLFAERFVARRLETAADVASPTDGG